MTKPAPSAAIPATTKPIGLVNAPSANPAIFTIGAREANTCTILPTTINTGPAATATTPSHFCQPAIGKLSHISPSTRLMLSANVTTELFKLLNNISMFAPS